MTALYLIQKEFKQIFRNKILPIIFILLPIVLINGVPRIATQEVKGLHFCVVDNNHTPTTERMIRRIDASKYIDLVAYCTTYDEALEQINSGDADIILEFRLPDIMLHANATNGTKGGMAVNYITQIIASQNMGSLVSTPKVKYINNPELDYKLYMVPALIGMVLILIVGFLPALNIVSEKEKGTIEQINVTPIKKWEFIVSKIIPYIVIGFFMVIEALLVAKAVFGFLPQGSIISIFLFVTLFCMLVSSFGLIVSNYTNTLLQGALTMFFFLVIFLLMSGLLTPIHSMPTWAQYLTTINPLRYFVEAIRAIYIKGATILDLHIQLIIMIVYSSLTWTWAILSYKKNS